MTGRQAEERTLPTGKRLAIARLSHEGNSFSPLRTGLAEFQRREWVVGEAARAFYAATRCELGAAVDFLAERPDWQGHFLRCAAAGPGGPVDSAVLRAIGEEILAGLDAGPWDGVYVSLHGALIGDSELAVDLGLVTAIRARIGDTPLAVSLDLHANLDPAMARVADIIVGYKTYPHVDTYETGARALVLLDGAASGRLAPVTRIVPLGAVLYSGNMRTESGPMRAVAAHARAAEAAPTVFAFFWDPELVARASAAGVGADLECRLGGRLVADYGAPVPAVARVLRLTDGRFVNRGPMERGLPVNLGPTAVLDVSGIQVIVTSACQSPNDLAYFDLHGINLGALRLLCVKAKNHFRAAFREVCAEIIDVDTRGPASADLRRLRYRRVPPDRLPATRG